MIKISAEIENSILVLTKDRNSSKKIDKILTISQRIVVITLK